MAKAATAAKPAEPQVATVGGFKIETGIPLPTIERKVGASSSPYAEPMKALPLGSTPETVASFFVPATVPNTITDPAEKAKALRDEARKISNRISGISRRLTKADPTLAFALRTKEENGNVGVRVYRVAPAAAESGAA
jgi:hypothetical protein